MDIFRFINSGVMRKHLKDMGYEFSSLEAAWLIYQCHSAPISEKHAAWKELIETMPDCEIAERFNTVPQKSLHAFLKKYMELEDRLIREFCDESYGIAGGNGEKSVYLISACIRRRRCGKLRAVFNETRYIKDG